MQVPPKFLNRTKLDKIRRDMTICFNLQDILWNFFKDFTEVHYSLRDLRTGTTRSHYMIFQT